MLRYFPIYPGCPVCGDPGVNRAALAVRWGWDIERRCVVGRFVPEGQHTGYADRLHGGILSALLDECLAWACAVAKRNYCMTGDLHLRFKAPAKLGETIEITGWPVTGWGPYVRAKGKVLSPRGELIATAASTFAVLSREESLQLRQALRFQAGDWDVLTDPGETENESNAAPLPLS